MNENSNISLTVAAWAEITVKEWVKRATALGIKPSDPLSVNRFHHFITTQSGGDPQKIEFTFDFYLKFVNWGVGRGVTIAERDTYILSEKKAKYQKGAGRRPKPWYDDVFPKQLTILGHLLAEKYGQRTVALVKTTMESANSDGTKPYLSTSSGTSYKHPKIIPGKEGYSVKDYKKVRVK